MRRLRAGVAFGLLLSAGCLLGSTAGAFGWPEQAARLEVELASDSPEVRRRAAFRLGHLSASASHRLVAQSLDDPDPEVRLAVASALASFRYRDLAPRVVGWLQDRDTRLRRAAVETLFQVPVQSAIEPLGRALSDADPGVRRGAAEALGAMSQLSGAEAEAEARGRATAELLGRLEDREPAVRCAVIDSLAMLGDFRAVLPLISKIQDGEPAVRIAVVRALSVLGDPSAGSALLLAARDRQPEVVAQAVQALGHLGDPAAIPSLIVLSQQPTPLPARRAALLALGRLSALESPEQARGLERLVAAVGEASVEAAARQAILGVGSRAAPLLELCLTQAAAQTGSECARLLVGVAGQEATGPIRRALERGSLGAARALEALGRTQSSDALIVALEHLTHPDPEARHAALEAVVRLLRQRGGDGRAAGPLLAARKADTWSTEQRVLFVEALGWSGDPAVGEALKVLAGSTDKRVKLAAIVALGRTFGHGQDEILLAALDDPAGDVRKAAALSLRATGSGESAHDLLTKLEVREGQDREAVALALRGPLGASRDPEHVKRALDLLERLPGAARDSMVEAIGATGELPFGARALAELAARGSASDRAKLAEILGTSAGHRELLRKLSRDAHAQVRAHAAWSMGDLEPRLQDRALVVSLLDDPEGAVVANGLGALGRWSARQSEPRVSREELGRLCSALEDSRPAVRANAARALFILQRECSEVTWSSLLQSDPAEQVRAFVADGLGHIRTRKGAYALEAGMDLRRCSAFERSRLVASRCDGALGLDEHSEPALGGPRSSDLVFVAARREARVLVNRPVLALEEGLVPESFAGFLRAGFTDRRGALTLPASVRDLRLLEVSLLRAYVPYSGSQLH